RRRLLDRAVPAGRRGARRAGPRDPHRPELSQPRGPLPSPRPVVAFRAVHCPRRGRSLPSVRPSLRGSGARCPQRASSGLARPALARRRLQSAAMAYLRLHDVAVALGGRDVVRDVTAEVAAGELIVVVGPNGAGKTTLLRAIAGLIAPRTGAIRVLGHD